MSKPAAHAAVVAAVIFDRMVRDHESRLECGYAHPWAKLTQDCCCLRDTLKPKGAHSGGPSRDHIGSSRIPQLVGPASGNFLSGLSRARNASPPGRVLRL